MSIADIIARAATQAVRGYSAWTDEVEPTLQARAQQRAARTRALAQQQYDFFLKMAGGDPDRAYEIFGEPFRTAAQGGFDVDLPTREEPIVEEGVISPARVEQRESFKIAPKTAPSLMERFGAQERGEQFVPKAFPTVEQVQVPEQRGMIPTGKTRKVLALPKSAEVMVDVPGLGRLRLEDAVKALGPEGMRNLIGIRDPDKLAQINMQMANIELGYARLELDKVKNVDSALHNSLSRQLRQLEIDALVAYRNAMIAEQQNNRAEAQRWHNMQAEIQREANRIRAAAGAGGVDEVMLRQLEQELRQGEDDLAEAESALNVRLQGDPGLKADPAALARSYPEEAAAVTAARDTVARRRARLEQAHRDRAAAQAGAGVQPAPATGRTYQTRHSGVLTSAQVQTIIRNMIASGQYSREQIRAALQANGIPPENFGYGPGR